MKNLTKIYETRILEDTELKDFEIKFGLNLPNNFKEFVRLYQNSKVKEILFLDEQHELWILNAFFSFQESRQLYKELLDVIKCKMLPFAFDPGGWHFCLCLDDKDYGAIYINRWTDHLPEEQFFRIADNFEEFIDGLQAKGVEEK